MIRTIDHDPFARQELVREMMDNYSECDECGQQRRVRGIVKSLFRYGTRSDAGNRVNWHRGGFCSKPRHDSYHS